MKRIYFDHCSTSPIHLNIQNKMAKIMKMPLNPSSIHIEGRNARNVVDLAREYIKKKLFLGNNYQLIFVSSCTEANNLVIRNFSHYKKICSNIDHQSIRNLNNDILISISVNGVIDLESFKELTKNNEKFLILTTYVNNEIGTIQPINQIKKLLKKKSSIFHCDITQAIGKIDINVQNIDFITLGCHKFGGPHGIGCLIYKKKFQINPIIVGGGQEYGMRSGTQNVIGINGFYHSFCMIEEIKNKFLFLKEMRNQIESEILAFTDKVNIIAINSCRLSNVSYIFMPNVNAETQVIFFDLNGIAVSSGSACSSGKSSKLPLLKSMGIRSEVLNHCLRVSLGPKNSFKEINRFIKLWKTLYIANH